MRFLSKEGLEWGANHAGPIDWVKKTGLKTQILSFYSWSNEKPTKLKFRPLKYDLKSNREGQIEQSSVSLDIKYFLLIKMDSASLV